MAMETHLRFLQGRKEVTNEQAMIDYNKMEEEWEMENYNEMNNEQQ